MLDVPELFLAQARIPAEHAAVALRGEQMEKPERIFVIAVVNELFRSFEPVFPVESSQQSHEEQDDNEKKNDCEYQH